MTRVAPHCSGPEFAEWKCKEVLFAICAFSLPVGGLTAAPGLDWDQEHTMYDNELGSQHHSLALLTPHMRALLVDNYLVDSY